MFLNDGGVADNLVFYRGAETTMWGVKADGSRPVLRKKKLGGLNGLFLPFCAEDGGDVTGDVYTFRCKRDDGGEGLLDVVGVPVWGPRTMCAFNEVTRC